MAEFLGGLVTKARESIKDTLDFVLVIVGVSASSAVVEAVRSWFPEPTTGIADETVTSVVGFLLWYFGDKIHPRLSPFGFGIFLTGVGAWASSWIAPLFAFLKKG
ncbi:MAG: hypothetical protein NC827_05955 [Candidatus Omnitrophica bacterium]|nr:hypothetical protein [Candidatus Omnitrophota bacterium]